MIRKKFINFSNLDYMLILLTLICVIFGIVTISSAVKSVDGGVKYIIIQSVAAVLGFCLMFFVSMIDYEKLGNFTKAIYIICIAFLCAVLVFGTGLEDTGSKSWIRFGPIGVQPSEFVKIGYIITFSKLCSSVGDELNKPKNIMKLLANSAIIMGLIMLQPDFGTTMVFIMIFIGIVFAARISYKYIIATGITIAAAIPIIWNFFLADYQKNRIMVLFNPEADPYASGYHVMQSKIAIGSGGIFGKGFGQGTQTQLGYLPVKHTDFIYSVIGEELGLIGCLAVAFLLFGIVLRCFYNARNSKNNFGAYICVGVGCMLLAHIFENIGMCIGLMPVTGIPLPFFSYGGSSMITSLTAIGLVLSVRKKQNEITFEDQQIQQ